MEHEVADLGELESELQRETTEEHRLVQRLAEVDRTLSAERAATRPHLRRSGPFDWGVTMFSVTFVISMVSRCGG